MQILSSLFYFIIVLGVIVFIHEFGHFIAAKLSGMRADIFSLGMGYRLFGYHKSVGFKFGALPNDFDYGENTDYRISLFPIGGYVKILGMIDESMDTKFAKTEVQPWEFRAKNPFQKIMTLSAGVIMNFLLAVIIYAFIAFFIGQTVYKSVTVGEVEKESIAEIIGFRQYDKIITINDIKMSSWNAIINSMTSGEFGNNLSIKIRRESKDTILKISNRSMIAMMTSKKPFGLNIGAMKTIASSVSKNSPAEKAGLKSGDTLISLGSIQIDAPGQIQKASKKYANVNTNILVLRNIDTINMKIKPNESGLIGIGLEYAPLELVKYGFFQSIGQGYTKSIETLGLIVKSLKQIADGSVSAKDAFGGPIMIADQANQMANRGLIDFMLFMAMLSISLALINILPVPALDGGHILIILIESIIRKELPEKLKIAIQQVGLVVILLLMVFFVYNDISRYF